MNDIFRIGILTHHYVHNFGAYMQAKALTSWIAEHFPTASAEIIDYRVEEHERINTRHFFGMKTSRGDTLPGYFAKLGLLSTHRRYEAGLPHSRRVNSAEEINALHYDLIIVGSDEVWNFQDLSFSPVKFGVGIEAPMMSYAASSGESSVHSEQIPACVAVAAEKFIHIGVRDDTTEELFRQYTDREITRTLDPVYLYDFPLDCGEKVRKIAEEKPYILIYDCHIANENVQAIVDYADRNHMNILGAGEYRKWYTTVATTNITPYEWAYLFRHASLVITGTFHGTSFSIKYRRPFIALTTEANRVRKVSSLLKEFGLGSHMIQKSTELVPALEHAEIDYEKYEPVIRRRIGESETYLRNCIGQQMEIKRA